MGGGGPVLSVGPALSILNTVTLPEKSDLKRDKCQVNVTFHREPREAQGGLGKKSTIATGEGHQEALTCLLKATLHGGV